jgi:hypothetical protein
MGKHINNLNVVQYQQVEKNFEIVKTAFRDNPSQPAFYINVPTMGTIKEAGIYGGNFEITRFFFNPP